MTSTKLKMINFRNRTAFFTLIVFCFFAGSTQAQQQRQQQPDVLIKGGHVIDPKNKIDGKMDVLIKAGKIAQVAANIPASTGSTVIDATGLYVTPGLIDMHVHVFNGNEPGSYIANGQTSVQVDAFTFRAGVTTVVDAGSSGWRNFRQFKEQTIDKAQTRVLALLNVVGTGMYGRFEEQDVSDMNPEMNAYMISKQFPQILVGLKSAHYWGGFTSVDKAVESGTLAKVPVMVDFGEHTPPNSIKDLFLKHLRPGDIFTHTYSYGPEDRETVADANGKVKPFIFEAQKRGIKFDVGHGGGAFTWRQAIPSIQQGFKPDVISSDLHTASMNSGMKDMTNLLSKFLNIGLTLNEVIERATVNPANIINRPELGNLSVGADADVSIFNVRKGDFGFLDVRRSKIKGTQKLEAELTMRSGRVVWDLNGLSSSMSEIQPAK
ncbi:MAG: amidohydrolase/deacetylase family metallohydrolase [Bacteroidota bacterium]